MTRHIHNFAFLLCTGAGILILGCTTSQSITYQDGRHLTCRSDYSILLKGSQLEPKSIFLFLDGTANDTASTTNVWRLYEQVRIHGNPQTVGRYIPGVGSIDEPMEEDPVLPFVGDALGRGMQTRILEGYQYISKNYKPGDAIYIFGFSRGAHQARALAGLLAYAGVPSGTLATEECDVKSAKIMKIVKESRDADFERYWLNWKPQRSPPLAISIKCDPEIGLDVQPVEIAFLGVWDTVPGSSFKDYGSCKEGINTGKKYFSWLPIVSKGERYKTDSYPPIRRIAQAVAADEKRSKFAPLYLCEPILSQYTTVIEKWFPGAHADVGGGYTDGCHHEKFSDFDLPNLSLSWMIGLLEESYQFATPPDTFSGNAKGIAHWSYGDAPANAGSRCIDRLCDPDRQPPLGYSPDESINARGQEGPMPIMIKNKQNTLDWHYPIACPGPGK